MKSDSLFLKCDTCGVLNNKTKKNCTSCGGKLKKSRKKIYIVSGALVFVFFLFMASDEKPSSDVSDNPPAAQVKPAPSLIPEDEQQLVSLSKTIRESFLSAKNELQKAVLRDERKKSLADLQLGHVSNWIGTISSLDTNSDGKAVLVVKLASGLSVSTWNNAFSDMQDYTLIEKETALYHSLLNLSVGQKVIFSGSFFPSSDDAVKEKSLTINGSLSEPDFLFKFETVKPI